MVSGVLDVSLRESENSHKTFIYLKYEYSVIKVSEFVVKMFEFVIKYVNPW